MNKNARHLIMEDAIMEDITTIFSQFAFPAAAYIGLFWWMIKSSEMHREETKELTKVIEQNSEAVAKLSVMIEERLPRNA